MEPAIVVKLESTFLYLIIFVFSILVTQWIILGIMVGKLGYRYRFKIRAYFGLSTSTDQEQQK